VICLISFCPSLNSNNNHYYCKNYIFGLNFISEIKIHGKYLKFITITVTTVTKINILCLRFFVVGKFSICYNLWRVLKSSEWVVFIWIAAIDRPLHTTGVYKFRAHKGNITGLESTRVPKLTRQPLHKPKHCQSPSNRNINMLSKRHLAVHYYFQVIDRVNTMISPNMYENSIGWRSLENVIDLHLPTFNSNALASHHSTSLFKSLWIFKQSRKPRTWRNSFMSSA
jgi:hypothetical protein